MGGPPHGPPSPLWPCPHPRPSWSGAGEPRPLHLPEVGPPRAAPGPRIHPPDPLPKAVEGPRLPTVACVIVTPTWLQLGGRALEPHSALVRAMQAAAGSQMLQLPWAGGGGCPAGGDCSQGPPTPGRWRVHDSSQLPRLLGQAPAARRAGGGGASGGRGRAGARLPWLGGRGKTALGWNSCGHQQSSAGGGKTRA